MRIFSLLAVFGILVGGCGEESTADNYSEFDNPPNCIDSTACVEYGRCTDNSSCNCSKSGLCWMGEPGKGLIATDMLYCCIAVNQYECQQSLHCLQSGICDLDGNGGCI
jgi:hypothetical protein